MRFKIKQCIRLCSCPSSFLDPSWHLAITCTCWGDIDATFCHKYLGGVVSSCAYVSRGSGLSADLSQSRPVSLGLESDNASCFRSTQSAARATEGAAIEAAELRKLCWGGFASLLWWNLMEHGARRHSSVSLVWHRCLPSIFQHHFLKPRFELYSKAEHLIKEGQCQGNFVQVLVYMFYTYFASLFVHEQFMVQTNYINTFRTVSSKITLC